MPVWPTTRSSRASSAARSAALWVVATNGAHSWINQSNLRELLGRLDLLVVQDMYTTTETAQLADIVLPAAGWAEKEGTFINSERRLGMVKRVAHAPGEALADFFIFKAVADAWGCGDLFARWTDPEATFAILQELTRGRPCDITGVDGYEHVDRGGVQWPLTEADAAAGSATSTARRDRWAHGRAPAVRRRPLLPPRRVGPASWSTSPSIPPERTSDRYPLVLLTGRGSSSQWHTGTRTRSPPLLRELAPDGLWLEIHPDDAAAPGHRPGTAGRGAVPPRDGGWPGHRSWPTVGRGQVFLPMHDPRVNVLTVLGLRPALPPARLQVQRGRGRPPRTLGAGQRADGARPAR